jgi:hypothetical protein
MVDFPAMFDGPSRGFLFFALNLNRETHPESWDPPWPARINSRTEVEPQESKEDFNQAKFREIIGFKDLWLAKKLSYQEENYHNLIMTYYD